MVSKTKKADFKRISKEINDHPVCCREVDSPFIYKAPWYYNNSTNPYLATIAILSTNTNPNTFHKAYSILRTI